MAKRNKTALPMEIIPRGPDQVAEEYKQMIARIVEEKVSEAMSHETDSIFQPFFQPKHISDEIRRRQPVNERRKYSDYFEDWGCLVCETREAGYGSLGMCRKCYGTRSERMRTTLRNHAPAPDQFQPTFTDSVRQAREALAPSLEVLTVRRGRDKGGK